ncbi:unnamed protein product [Closterium sp. NIES-64]|nr:unnamed protein product [Closterium sp. NIES-64]
MALLHAASVSLSPFAALGTPLDRHPRYKLSLSSFTSSYGGLRLSAAPRSAVARGSRPPRATPLRGSSASASSSDRGASAGDGAPLRQNALTNFSPLTTGVATGKAAQCVPVDLRLAVLLGGLAFEAYSTPEQGSDKLSDKDGQGCEALFTSTPFAHELFQGQLSVRELRATGNIMARHAELALVTSAGKPATWNGVACTSKAENLMNPSWPEQLQLLVPRASPSDTYFQVFFQINLHYWNADNDDDDTNDYVVGTATIALNDLIKGSNTQIPEVVGLTLTHDDKKTGSVSMEVGYTSFSDPRKSLPALPTHPSFEPLPILQKLIDAPLPKSATVPQAGSKAVDEAAAYGLTLTDQRAVETLFSSGADAVKLAAWENLSRAAAGEQQEFFKSAFECVCFLSGDRTDTQVFVWRDKDPLRKRLVVAFRGTEFDLQKFKISWMDVLTDFRLWENPFDSDLTEEDNKAGVKVHRGFLNSYKSVTPRLIPLLKAILSSSNEKYHIMVTGHSLGAALSTIFTYDLAQSDFKKQNGFTLSLYNFGSPRVGNRNFAARFYQVRIA